MREILFRGKRLDTGEWVEGSFLRDGEAHRFVEQEGLPLSDCYIVPKTEWDNVRTYLTQGILLNTIAYHVDPATVGQFTGLTDKNGNKIFEGDIIKTHYANALKADFIEEVVFHNGRFCALYQKDGCKMWQSLADGVPHHPMDRLAYMECCEVIGNIHDNPELLE